MKEKLDIIKNSSHDMSILYVEDNVGLCNNMQKLLGKVFDNIHIAHDGQEGYEKFLEYKPKIVITDINMPNMNGFKMTRKIKENTPECKIIIMSAHDENKHLHTAINLGVFRYLNKPAKAEELIHAIYETVLSLQKEEDRNMFFNQLKTIFNYQNNLIVMMKDKKLILPNQRFLEFFGVDDLRGFSEKYSDIDKLLLEHKGFLYSNNSSHWYDIATVNPGKLYHVKMEDINHEKRHLILKLRDIPEKDGYSILSFDDITELNLMGIFDEDASKDDSTHQDKMAVISLLQIVKNNSSEIKIHNFYKGLTIVNPAVVTDINDDEFTLKTLNPQLKIVNLIKFMTLSSEVFPKSVVCKSIKEINIDKQTITVNDMNFSPRSATDRKYTRLEPDEKQSCSLFYRNIKFPGDVSIVDLSEVSIKLEIDSLPAGMVIDEKVKISITLKINGRLISIPTEASIYRIDTRPRSYHLVLLFEVDASGVKNIREYLAIRQMELIREFRSYDI